MSSSNASFSELSPDGNPLSEEHRFILDMLDKGKITAVEALQLIQALPGKNEDLQSLEAGLDGPDSQPEPASGEFPTRGMTGAVETFEAGEDGYAADYESVEASTEETLEPDWAGRPQRSPLPAEAEKWRSWWQLPLWIGVGATVGGALLLFWALMSAGLGFLVFCASLPFWAGVALIALAWGSRTARWIHIRIDQRPGSWPQRIAFGFPIPLSLTAWFLRTFGGWIPGLEGTSIDEVLTALQTSTSSENPLFIDVQDDEDGEHVQVFIG